MVETRFWPGCRRPWAFFLVLSLSLGLADANVGAARVESIKQQALALHTLRLSDQRQYSRSAAILLQQIDQNYDVLSVQLSVDERHALSRRYALQESRILAQGGTHALGHVELDFGPREIQAELSLRQRGTNNEPFQLSARARLSLQSWPRGFMLVLDKHAGRLGLQLQDGITAESLLASARHELAMERPGPALPLLQTAAHLDPALSSEPRHLRVLAEALEAWGLDSAAEQTYRRLGNAGRDQTEQAAARLDAAALALERGDQAAARTLLASEPWPDSLRDRQHTLLAHLSLAEGQPDVALKLMPQDAEALWRYNLAATLLAQGRRQDAQAQLGLLAATPARSERDRDVAERGALALAYMHLNDLHGDLALEALKSITADSAHATPAALARGWAHLATLGGPRLQADDGVRPAFIQRIQASLAARPRDDRARDRALRQALEAWVPALQGDPLDPAVQEALVALPYALAEMGEYDRARPYIDQAVQKLDAAREHIRQQRAQARRGQVVDLSDLTAAGWPPRPYSWRQHDVTEAWWQTTPVSVPAQAFRRFLLRDPATHRFLEAVSLLGEADRLAASAAESPDLSVRAERLRQQIQAEREVQQKALNRHVFSWLLEEFKRTTHYLVMARLMWAQLDEKQAQKP